MHAKIRVSLLFGVLSLATGCSTTDGADPREPHPVLVVDRSEIDAGEVLQGETARFTFVLRNTGQSTLEIEVQGSCSCTRPSYDKTIPPGGTGKLETSLRTDNLHGPKNETLVMRTNDPRQQRLDLKLAVQVVEPIDVRRGHGDMVLKGGVTTHEQFLVKVFGTLDGSAEPHRLTQVEVSDAPYAQVTFEAVAGEPGLYRVNLSVDATAPSGRSWLTLYLHSSRNSEPLIAEIPCVKGLVASPDTLSFGQIQANAPQPVSRPLLLRDMDAPFKIIKITSSDPNVSIRDARPVADDRSRYLLTVICRGGSAPGPHRALLRIETDALREPVVELRATYVVVGGDRVSKSGRNVP